MPRRLLTLLAALAASLLVADGTAEPEPLVIASVPWRGEATLARIYAPTLELLERELGREVRFFVAGDYQELGERIRTGAVDIGIFGGNSYVEAKATNPHIRYLATEKGPRDHYRSYILAARGGPVDSLAALKGRSFAFTDTGSTSGYVYPRMVLRDGGVDPDREIGPVFLLKQHDKVYDAIARGVVAAGGASSTAYDGAVARNGEVYRLVARSEPIPNNAHVAGPGLPEALFERVRKVLAEAERDPRFHADSRKIKGYSVRSDAFYDVVRKAREMGER